jgi:hypothetical protein
MNQPNISTAFLDEGINPSGVLVAITFPDDHPFHDFMQKMRGRVPSLTPSNLDHVTMANFGIVLSTDDLESGEISRSKFEKLFSRIAEVFSETISEEDLGVKYAIDAEDPLGGGGDWLILNLVQAVDEGYFKHKYPLEDLHFALTKLGGEFGDHQTYQSRVQKLAKKYDQEKRKVTIPGLIYAMFYGVSNLSMHSTHITLGTVSERNMDTAIRESPDGIRDDVRKSLLTHRQETAERDIYYGSLGAFELGSVNVTVTPLGDRKNMVPGMKFPSPLWEGSMKAMLEIGRQINSPSLTL